MRYRNVVCRDCGLVYICPRPIETAFEAFYERLYPRAPEDETPTERGVAVTSFLQASFGLPRHTGDFDIGYGGGGVLRAFARGHGWQPILATDAPKGDHWVLASRAEPDPNALAATPGHCREVVGLISSYREWVRRRAETERLLNQ